MGRAPRQTLTTQAERMYEVYSELARAFQLRDRDHTGCWGLSVAQCHALEMVSRRGALTMRELARALFLDASTVTRLVDRLAGAGLVARVTDTADHRVCRVHATEAGLGLYGQIRADLIAEQARVLRGLPAAAREPVIEALGRLLDAFRGRQGACCADLEATGIGTGKRDARDRAARR